MFRLKFSILLVAISWLTTFLQSCKKETDIYSPYYGTWYARGCVSNGGPFNCGLPYPIPRDRNITLVINSDKSIIKTAGSSTIQGTYTINRVRDSNWNGNDIEFDKLTMVYNGQSVEYKINIEGDGALSVYELNIGYYYIK